MFDGLDTKAGLILGFAGVIVALSHRVTTGLSLAGHALATVAALFAMLAFLPRRYGEVDVRGLRREFAGADEHFTKVALLDAHLQVWEALNKVFPRKQQRLKLSMVCLGASVIIVMIDALIR